MLRGIRNISAKLFLLVTRRALFGMADASSVDSSPAEERLRGFEKHYEPEIPDDMFLMIRIDGKRFSKWTAVFTKPFDERISVSLADAAESLMKEMNGSMVYTASDEISVGVYRTVVLLVAGSDLFS